MRLFPLEISALGHLDFGTGWRVRGLLRFVDCSQSCQVLDLLQEVVLEDSQPWLPLMSHQEGTYQSVGLDHYIVHTCRFGFIDLTLTRISSWYRSALSTAMLTACVDLLSAMTRFGDKEPAASSARICLTAVKPSITYRSAVHLTRAVQKYLPGISRSMITQSKGWPEADPSVAETLRTFCRASRPLLATALSAPVLKSRS